MKKNSNFLILISVLLMTILFGGCSKESDQEIATNKVQAGPPSKGSFTLTAEDLNKINAHINVGKSPVLKMHNDETGRCEHYNYGVLSYVRYYTYEDNPSGSNTLLRYIDQYTSANLYQGFTAYFYNAQGWVQYKVEFAEDGSYTNYHQYYYDGSGRLIYYAYYDLSGMLLDYLYYEYTGYTVIRASLYYPNYGSIVNYWDFSYNSQNSLSEISEMTDASHPTDRFFSSPEVNNYRMEHSSYGIKIISYYYYGDLTITRNYYTEQGDFIGQDIFYQNFGTDCNYHVDWPLSIFNITELP